MNNMPQFLINLKQPIVMLLEPQKYKTAVPFKVSAFVGEKIQNPSLGWEQWRVIKPLEGVYVGPDGMIHKLDVLDTQLSYSPLVELASDLIGSHQHLDFRTKSHNL